MQQTGLQQHTTGARPGAGPALDARAITAIRDFLLDHYDRQAGYMELSTIEGDPDDRRPGGHTFRQRWRHFTLETSYAIARECYELGQTHGNVYISRGLYAGKGRDTERLPGRRVFLDDAPAPAAAALPYSAAVQTSVKENGYHAYYDVTEQLPAAVLSDLARRAAAATSSDRAGADEQQLVRVPHTYNTKGQPKGTEPAAGYPVSVVVEHGPRYTRRQLEQAWPKVTTPARTTEAPALDGDGIADLYRLGVQLLGTGRLRKIAENTKQRAHAARVLRGERVSLPRKDGTLDDSTSIQRAALADGLVFYRYPDTEAMAVLLAFGPVWEGSEHKPWSWRYTEAARVVGNARAKYTDRTPQPTLFMPGQMTAGELPPPQERPSRASGRPTVLTPDDLLAFYREHRDAGDVCLMTRTEAAIRLGTSIATLDRLERKLREQGALHRITSKDRRRSSVVLGPIKTPPSLIVEAPQTATLGAENGAISVVFDSTEQATTTAQTAITIETTIERKHTPQRGTRRPYQAPTVTLWPGTGAALPGAVCSLSPASLVEPYAESATAAGQVTEPAAELGGGDLCAVDAIRWAVGRVGFNLRKVLPAIEAAYPGRWSEAILRDVYQRERRALDLVERAPYLAAQRERVREERRQPVEPVVYVPLELVPVQEALDRGDTRAAFLALWMVPRGKRGDEWRRLRQQVDEAEIALQALKNAGVA